MDINISVIFHRLKNLNIKICFCVCVYLFDVSIHSALNTNASITMSPKKCETPNGFFLSRLRDCTDASTKQVLN